MTKRSFLFLTIVLATALVLLSVSCRGTDPSTTIHPFILFGVDGADWEVVEWMWEQDLLPHLKGLGFYLRYLRHLRAELGGWESRTAV